MQLQQRLKIKKQKTKRVKSLFLLISIIEILFLIFNLPVHADNRNIAVTATVPPSSSDFQFSFISTDGLTTVPQNTTLSYQLIYGSKTSAGVSTTTTLVADWSADTAPDSSHVLDYVIGSAGNGYNNSTPVVDLTNRTITWTINNFPSGTTDQTVAFQLKTNSNYTQATPVNFTIRAKMNNQYATMPDQTVRQTYQYNASLITPTPTLTPTPISPLTTPTAGPTATPRPNPTATLIPTLQQTPTIQPTPIPQAFSITDVSFINISETQGTIEVVTNKSAKLSFSYGTKPNVLNKTATSNAYSQVNDIPLIGLTPNTIYYLQITAYDQNAEKIISEIFTFHTAQTTGPSLKGNIAVLTSGGNVILSEVTGDNNQPPPLTILTNGTEYELTYTFKQLFLLRSLEAIVRTKTLDSSKQTTITVPLLQKEPGVYVAHLRTFDPQRAILLVKIADTIGNLLEQNISELKVISHLSVSELGSNNPLGDARVYLWYFDRTSKIYKPLNPAIFGNIKNPMYTNKQGEINVLLPQGKYRVEGSALFYDDATKDFSLGSDNGEQFPNLYLKRDPLNLFFIIKYLKNVFMDSLQKLMSFIHMISVSVRFFDTFSALIMTSSIGLSFLLFFFRTHINFKKFPHYMLFHLHMIFLNKENQLYFIGTVVNKQEKRLSQVRIEVLDNTTQNILTHVETNKAGQFYIRNTFVTSNLSLVVTKDGYAATNVPLTDGDQSTTEGMKIILNKGIAGTKSVIKNSFAGLEHLAGVFFEASLLISGILELVYLSLFGLEKTLPFFALSFLNIVLWILFLKESRS